MPNCISIDNIPFAVFRIDFKGIIFDCNEHFYSISGYDSEQLLGKSVTLIFPQIIPSTELYTGPFDITAFNAIANSNSMLILDNLAQKIPCSIRVSEEKSGFIFFVKTCLGIEKDNVEPTTKDVKQVLSSIEQSFWEWDLDKNVVYYSSHMMAMLGYEEVAYTGSAMLGRELVTKDVLKNIYAVFGEHLLGNTPCVNITFPIKTKHYKTKWLCVVGKILAYKKNKPHKIFGSVKDVTENQQLVESLKEKNNYLVLAENLNNTGHWRYDIATNGLFWSKGVYKIHGLDPKLFTVNVDNAVNLYISDQQDLIREKMSNAITLKQGFYLKSVIKHVSGKPLKIEVLAEVEIDAEGEVSGIFGVCRDITKSEDTIEKLKLLALVNNTIKVPIFFIDEDDNIVYQDLSPQDSGENSILFNYINFNFSTYLEYKAKAKADGQCKQMSISFDKYSSVFDLSVTYERDEGIYIWIVENISDRFHKDQQQVISNRLTLLGNTFGNVSHDINNVLGVALGATEMLELKFNQGERDIHGYIERVKNAIDKGKSVTERLLAFTRQPTVKVVAFDPIKEIEDNQYLFKQLLLPTIELILDIKNVNCVIRFPQGEFINILLNLVLNSQDAIQGIGLIGSINISANLTADNLLEIHLQDSGIGIESENISKIFDPFYSNKVVTKGNGIGLANVYTTMYEYQGLIQVEGKGELGGAHFTLIFKCEASPKLKEHGPSHQKTLHMIGKRVLILDDEETIAEFISIYLQSQNVLTTYVTTKEELMSALASDEVFDVFITDMILPDMSGREGVSLVKAKFPSINIYSISGYIEEEDKEWPYPVLRKPFNAKELCDFLTL
jgi:PAS domain S-box-containing protein